MRHTDWIDRGPGHIRLGRVLFDLGASLPESPIIDGAVTNMASFDDDGNHVGTTSFGGYWFRLPGLRSLTVSWRGARIGNPFMFRPRYVARRFRWRAGSWLMRPFDVARTPTPGAYSNGEVDRPDPTRRLHW